MRWVGVFQTEPAPIVCRDGEDKAGQRQDICKQCKTSPQRCADPNPNAPTPPRHTNDVIPPVLTRTVRAARPAGGCSCAEKQETGSSLSASVPRIKGLNDDTIGF